jgi:hypothetical protein
MQCLPWLSLIGLSGRAGPGSEAGSMAAWRGYRAQRMRRRGRRAGHATAIFVTLTGPSHFRPKELTNILYLIDRQVNYAALDLIRIRTTAPEPYNSSPTTNSKPAVSQLFH